MYLHSAYRDLLFSNENINLLLNEGWMSETYFVFTDKFHEVITFFCVSSVLPPLQSFELWMLRMSKKRKRNHNPSCLGNSSSDSHCTRISIVQRVVFVIFWWEQDGQSIILFVFWGWGLYCKKSNSASCQDVKSCEDQDQDKKQKKWDGSRSFNCSHPWRLCVSPWTMSEEMVFRLILKPWNSRVLLAGPVQWRRNPEATPPVEQSSKLKQVSSLPCLVCNLASQITYLKPRRQDRCYVLAEYQAWQVAPEVCPHFTNARQGQA